jgi:hypothetical protein
MSRCLTLEEYLQEFVDENTESARGEVKLLVTNQQAQTLGFFLIHGLAGFVECVRLQRGSAKELDLSESEEAQPSQKDGEPEEFIN